VSQLHVLPFSCGWLAGWNAVLPDFDASLNAGVVSWNAESDKTSKLQSFIAL
jgi:hypothetical protein